MGECRGTRPGSQARDREILLRIDARRVSEQQADPDGTVSEVRREEIEDPGDLLGGRGALPSGISEHGKDAFGAAVQGVASKHVHADRRPRSRKAVVNRRAFPGLT